MSASRSDSQSGPDRSSEIQTAIRDFVTEKITAVRFLSIIEQCGIRVSTELEVFFIYGFSFLLHDPPVYLFVSLYLSVACFALKASTITLVHACLEICQESCRDRNSYFSKLYQLVRLMQLQPPSSQRLQQCYHDHQPWPLWVYVVVVVFVVVVLNVVIVGVVLLGLFIILFTHFFVCVCLFVFVFLFFSLAAVSVVCIVTAPSRFQNRSC